MTELMTINRFTENQDQFMTDLIESKGANLPAKIEDVLNIFEFTDFKAKAFKMMSNKLEKLDDQSEAYQTAIRSGQHWGISALYCQKKMGEITKEIPAEKNMRNTMKNGVVLQREIADGKKDNIASRTWKDAETLARNPETLDRVIDATIERGEIPTKTAVLNTIRVENARERDQQRVKKSNDKLENQRSQSVSDYYEVIKGFKAGILFATIAAECGKFDPSGKNFLIKKHNEIREMLIKLEELI